MKQFYVFFTLVILLFINFPDDCFSQRWINSYSDFNGISTYKDIKFIDGSIYGLVNKNIKQYDGAEKAYLVKIDRNGNIIWSKSIIEGTGLSLEYYNNSLYIGGFTKGDYRFYGKIVRCNLEGNIKWEKSFDEGFISTINPTPEGIYVGGNSDQAGSSSKSYIAYLDYSGNLLWEKKYQISSNSSVISIYVNQDELILVSDASTVGAGFEGIYIYGIKQVEGDILWWNSEDLGYFESYLRYELPREFNSQRDENGNIVIVYPANSYGKSAILKYNSSGALLSKNYTYNIDEGSHPHHLKILENGDYLIAGTYQNNNHEFYCNVERRKNDGSIVWQKIITDGVLFTLDVDADTLYFAGTNSNIYRPDEVSKPLLGKMTIDGKLFNSTLNFSARIDKDRDCIDDGNTKSAKNLSVKVDGKSYFTDENGILEVDLPIGTHDIHCRIDDNLQFCSEQNTFDITYEGEVVNIGYLLKYKDCQDISVDINQGELIRCETNKIYIECRNNSNIKMDNPKVILKYNKDLSVVSSSYGFESIGNQLIFDLNSLGGQESKLIEIDFDVPCDLDLFSVNCFEVEVYPKVSCNDDISNYAGSNLELISNCNGDNLNIEIRNNGADMAEQTNYSIFNNGFEFESGSILLKHNESVNFQYAPMGNTISLIAEENKENPLNSKEVISIEGCGSQSNGNFSKGFKRMFIGSNTDPWRSSSCMEIRDFSSKNRIFEIPRGLGYYHVFGTDKEQFEFALMFKNESEYPLTDFTIEIVPDSYFDPGSFKKTMSSHQLIDPVLKENTIILKNGNEKIDAGENLYFRFKINKKEVVNNINFCSINATIKSNGNNYILSPGFYNLRDSLIIDTISPFTIIENGYLFGKGNSHDFMEDIFLSADGSNFLAYNAYEFGSPQQLVLNKTNGNQKLMWQKSYVFKEGNYYFRSLLGGKNGELFFVGTLGPNNPENYGGFKYLPFILAVNNEGKELWRQIYPAFDSYYRYSEFNNGIVLSNGNLLLTGASYKYKQYENFVVELNPSGQILKQEKLLFDSFYETTAATKILPGKSGEYYFYFMNSDKNFEIIKTNTDFNQLKYALYDTKREGIYTMNISYNNEKDKIIMACDGYRIEEKENGFDILPFGRIIRYDSDLNYLDENEFFEDEYIFEFNDVKAKGDDIYISGSWYPSDTISNSDILWLKMDTLGNINRLESRDFGAREYNITIKFNDLGNIFTTIQTQTQDEIYDLQAGYFFSYDSDLVNTNDDLVQNNDKYNPVFPNPAKDYFKIKGYSDIKSLKVINMKGQSFDLESVNGKYQISNLKTGLYLVAIKDENNTIHFGKLTKVK